MKNLSWQSAVSRRLMTTILTLAFVVFWTGCSDNSQNVVPTGAGAKAKALDAPSITCASSTQSSISLTITAGLSGTPAGFTVQWMTSAALAAANGVWPSSSAVGACDASFSGNANLSRYNLLSGGAVTIEIGEILLDNGASTRCPGALECGTEYAFRVFAHSTSTVSKSGWANQLCSTLSCNVAAGCVYSQGYWKNKSSQGKASPKIFDALGNLIGYQSLWPVHSLTLGTVTYSETECVAIWRTSPQGGNTYLKLAHQLMAAKLNVIKLTNDGVTIPQAVIDAIAAGDALIASADLKCGITITTCTQPYAKDSAMNTVASQLDLFNTGDPSMGGFGDCSDDECADTTDPCSNIQ